MLAWWSCLPLFLVNHIRGFNFFTWLIRKNPKNILYKNVKKVCSCLITSNLKVEQSDKIIRNKMQIVTKDKVNEENHKRKLIKMLILKGEAHIQQFS